MVWQTDRKRVTLAIFFTFLGCSANVVFLEALVREDVNCTNLITFLQFAFIALDGLIFTSKFFTQKTSVPLRHYVALVVMFFLVSVSNNYALSCDIAMPLHMIFRSGSLITSMLLGIILLHKRYNLRKYSAVLMITIGIVTCTWASAKQPDNENDSTKPVSRLAQFLGIFLLTFALFCSALMGVYQERMAIKYGKHPGESLFYLHFLPLPFFAFLAPSLIGSATHFNNSAPMLAPLNIPYAWLLMALNVLTQYVCIRSVFVLTTECACLTVTLVVTLRKFVSLVISIFYFGNPFTVLHWIGACLVFGGTFIFVDVDWSSLWCSKKKSLTHDDATTNMADSGKEKSS